MVEDLFVAEGTWVQPPGQMVWDLWWKKWHWDTFTPSSPVFPYNSHSSNAQ